MRCFLGLRRTARRVLPAGVLVLAGCAGRTPAPLEGAWQGPEVAIELENQGWSDVIIYLVRGTQAVRLGTVGSLRSATFAMPFRRLGAGEVRLRARAMAGAAEFTSETLLVRPGQRVKWTLPSELSRSFLAVYQEGP